MSESVRQARKPQGKIGGSVPVLFSLRNVQPSIVAGTSKSKTTTNSDAIVATIPTPQVASASTSPIASAKPAPASKSNRSYNIVVGLLIFAVCLIVIKNTQKNSSKGSIAAKSESSKSDLPKSDLLKSDLPKSDSKKPDVSKPDAPKVDTTVAHLASTTTSPFVLTGPGETSRENPRRDVIPPLPSLDSRQSHSETAVTSNTPSISLDPISLKESNVVQVGRTDAQQASQQSPMVPLLLPSSKPAFQSNTSSNSIVASPTTNNSDLSYPEPRTAMKSDGRPSDSHPSNEPSANVSKPNASATSSEPKSDPVESYRGSLSQNQPSKNNATFPSPSAGGASSSAIRVDPQIVETRQPNVTTREMLDVFLSGQNNNSAFQSASSKQSIPANPVSATGPKFESPEASAPGISNAASKFNYGQDNGMMSGSAYPPITKEYKPISIRPEYELGARNNVGTPTTTIPNSQSIRQPTSTNNSNRYPPAAPIPYKPMAPAQSGMTGYPPGIGN